MGKCKTKPMLITRGLVVGCLLTFLVLIESVFFGEPIGHSHCFFSPCILFQCLFPFQARRWWFVCQLGFNTGTALFPRQNLTSQYYWSRPGGVLYHVDYGARTDSSMMWMILYYIQIYPVRCFHAKLCTHAPCDDHSRLPGLAFVSYDLALRLANKNP